MEQFLTIETEVLTPAKYEQLKRDGYTHMQRLGSVPGLMDPGASIGEVFEPVRSFDKLRMTGLSQDDITEIDDPYIEGLVKMENDVIECHVEKGRW